MIAQLNINGKNLRCKVCKTMLDQIHGLMFAKNIDCAVFIFSRSGKHPIHSHFVPKTFHAFYLDENKHVIDSILNIPPGKWKIEHKGNSRYLIEIFADVDISRLSDKTAKHIIDSVV